MDINGWLTIITVFTAIFALLPKEDLVLRFQRTYLVEKILVSASVVVIMPFLIIFEKLVQHWAFFEMFTVSWGFASPNIAFALFYACLLWLIFRLFFVSRNYKPETATIGYFIELLNEKHFEEFFKVFTKFNSQQIINSNWEQYKSLFTQPKFLQNVLANRPTYLLQFWSNFDNENEFTSIFRLFLENPNSVYYKEIKEHWNSHTLLDDKPFLDTVIKTNLYQSVHNGILNVFTDHVSRHLQTELGRGKDSIYNHEHYYSRIREEEGAELPIYYHIHFIGLMYSTAIATKVDISSISNRYTNMQSIYSSIIEKMIDNVIIANDNVSKEYPTNYHWLIGEIFSVQSNWLSLFSDEYYPKHRYFDKDSGYVDFIPFSLSLCITELFKGLNAGKISIKFLNSTIHYFVFSHYFSTRLNDTIRDSIEKEIITKIPPELFQPILNFSLNEKFAIDFNDFANERFRLAKGREREILLRLLKYLRDNNLISSSV